MGLRFDLFCLGGGEDGGPNFSNFDTTTKRRGEGRSLPQSHFWDPSIFLTEWGLHTASLWPITPPVETHLVTFPENRTFKCYAGAVTGCWIVNVHWAGPYFRSRETPRSSEGGLGNFGKLHGPHFLAFSCIFPPQGGGCQPPSPAAISYRARIFFEVPRSLMNLTRLD